MLLSSRRQFLQRVSWTVGAWLVPLRAPAVGRFCGQEVKPRRRHFICGETGQQLLNLAVTVEALATTCYYQAITTTDGFFAALPTAYQRYLCVALDEEWFHYDHLVNQHRATPLQNTFYFPADLFATGSFADFLATLDQLEMSTIAFYLAAIRQLGELDEPLLAALFGQLLGIEAEHRVMGREMAQNSPPAPNNLCYERAAFVCAAEVNGNLASYFNGSDAFTDPVALPTQAQVESAVGTATCEAVAPVTAASCNESLVDILTTAATAEALGITFYYHAIQGDFFAQLSSSQQWYLQAALDEERHHLDFLLGNGAASPPTTFFFPAGVFDDRAQCLTLLDTLENAFIGAYLAAIQRFQALGEPLLAEITGQILGVESEHRVLGRVLQGEILPHNRCLAQAAYQCVAEAGAALAPFVAGSAELPLEKTQPTPTEIDSAVDRFGCTPVPLASLPPDLYLPLILQEEGN